MLVQALLAESNKEWLESLALCQRAGALAGILGLEIFERFAVRIDYCDLRLSLTPLSTFRFSGNGARVPLTFQGDMPLAPGAINGHSGMFGVDTGNSGLLILYGRWLARTGLRVSYPHGIAAKGSGTGGRDSGYIAKIRTFAFGGRNFHNVAAMFTDMNRARSRQLPKRETLVMTRCRISPPLSTMLTRRSISPHASNPPANAYDAPHILGGAVGLPSTRLSPPSAMFNDRCAQHHAPRRPAPGTRGPRFKALCLLSHCNAAFVNRLTHHSRACSAIFFLSPAGNREALSET